MLCQECKKNQATARVTYISKGRQVTRNLCESCLAKKQGSSFAGGNFGDDLFGGGSIFDQLFSGGTTRPSLERQSVDVEESFSERTEELLNEARKIAKDCGARSIDTQHLLLALSSDTIVKRLLKEVKVKEEKLSQKAKDACRKSFLSSKTLQYSPRVKKVLDLAYQEAYGLGHSYVGPEHLFLGLIREDEGIAAQILKDLGATYKKTQDAVAKVVGEGAPEGKVPTNTPTLDQFSRDLTAEAREGKIDPVIGRSQEIETTVEILSRRTKNNPVLIGEPGVGKTAIVEGLAARIAGGQVPEILLEKRVVALDLSGILAGTQFRGQFEERLKKIIEEIRANSQNLVVFIDELHTVVGAGSTGETGTIDAANMLKPALARGELHMIGATTLNEYRKYVEKDAALERRFQPIIVPEPTVEQTIEILRGIKDRYEAHHRVEIEDKALVAAAELSDRYISDRFLPDKAIDLVDQAASRVRIRSVSEPAPLRDIKEQIKYRNKEKAQTSAAQDFHRADQIKKEIEMLEAKKRKMQNDWKQETGSGQARVTIKDIATIVARQTGIPVADLAEEEREKLLQLEERMQERLIGQEEAVKVIAEAVRRGRAGLKSENRPIGSFIFLGPTGVGKTELAKTLAEVLFGDVDAMIRLDMSEYMEKHTVSRLIGAPPGYVGYEEAGQLTEAVCRRPYSVILLDEIEKAHPEVFDILLQILDDGRLTDGKGKLVDFKNTIIIATSNIGSGLVSEMAKKEHQEKDKQKAAQIYQETKSKMLELLRTELKPEFLNRVDEIVVFHSLSKDQIREIVKLTLDATARLLHAQGLKLHVTDAALNEIAHRGYDPIYGARPIKRVVIKEIENKISSLILQQKFTPGDTILIDFQKSEFTFNKK